VRSRGEPTRHPVREPSTARVDADDAGARPERLWPVLVLLGFSTGLPQPLVDSTLSTWLAQAGHSPAVLVQVGWVTVPFTLKVLWAPLVDRFVPRLLGRRRGWILGCQLAVLAGVALLARADPVAGLGLLVLAAALVSTAGATQDLVVNGYTCEVAPRGGFAPAAGLLVWGFRLAWLTSGGLVLVAADRWGWNGAYRSMLGLLALGLLATALAREPERGAPPVTLRAALVDPLVEWRRTLGRRGIVLLFAFALLYRLPDTLANLLAVPFQASLYDLTALGLSRGVIGLIGAGLGVVIAAATIARLGEWRALFLFGGLQALSNLGYVGLDQRWWGGTGGLIAVLLAENLCGALAATAFVAHLMRRCTSTSAATQFALLATVALLGPHVLRAPLAALMPVLGWSGFFTLTAAAAAPGLLAVAALRRSAERERARAQ
jgi:PAT family beta-lactamase induction signal transducer AmpG